MMLSVVVTIVEGGELLERCLVALERQLDAPELEVIVPFDSTTTVPSDRFPRVRFIDMGRVETEADPSSHAGQHELFDRRRAHGLAVARGDIIAIVEDRGIPTRDWASTVMRLHRELPHAVIGGAVENGIDRLRNWAVYFCDFGRYARPFEAGPADWVTDVNVSYKRRALEQTEELWRQRYHEPIVHSALKNLGETLFLTPELVVEQMRASSRVVDMLEERVHWGRLFAYTRVKQSGPFLRAFYLGASPLIPTVMFVRQARLQLSKRAHLGRFLAASPAVATLLAFWGVGEAIGYLTGKPSARQSGR
jgi:hypothetical protein